MDIQGGAADGRYAILSRPSDGTDGHRADLIRVEIMLPGGVAVKTHHVSACDDPVDQRSMARCLVEQLDGVTRLPRSAVDTYFMLIRLLAD